MRKELMMTSKSLTQKILKTYDLAPGVFAFSTTRHGGVSKGSYGEMNINAYCGDEPEAIAANRRILEGILGISDDRLIMPHQVHLARNLAVDDMLLSLPKASRLSLLEGIDSLTTNIKNVCIGISTADCIPVLLYDPRHHAAAAIHAGWRGTVRRIVQHTLRAMGEHYGTDCADITAVIGPGISLKNFEVGDEVYEAFANEHFDMGKISKRYAKWHIDLPLCNQLQLESMGVARDHIIQSGICTYVHADDFFSARRLGVKSGRIYTGIILK